MAHHYQDSMENLDAYNPYDDGRELPTDKFDGWLWRKGEKNVFGRSNWVKLWAVFDPDLWSIRFYETQQDYFNGEECGEITTQRIRKVEQLVGNKNGRRFNVVAFDGTLYKLIGDSYADTIEWCKILKAFEEPVPEEELEEEAPVGFSSARQIRRSSLGKDPMQMEAMQKAAEQFNDGADTNDEEDMRKAMEEADKAMYGDGNAEDEESKTDEEQPTRERAPTFQDALAPLTALKGLGGSFVRKKKKKKPDAMEVGELKEEDISTDPRGRRYTDALGNLAGNSNIKRTERTYTVKVGKEEIAINEAKEKDPKKTHVRWEFTLDDKPVVVDLWHGRVWGKRTLSVDGEQIHASRKILDDGSFHPFEVSGRKLVAVIGTKGFSGFSYTLSAMAKPKKKEKKGRQNICVIGSSGYVGTATAKFLAANVSKDHNILAGVRNPASHRAAALREIGPAVTLVSASLSNPDELRGTLADVDRLFIVTPGTEKRVALTQLAIDIAKELEIGFVVILSLITADTDTIFGRQYKEIESYVKNSGLNYCILRVPMFIDNNWSNASTIQNEGRIYGCQRNDAPFTPVCVKDIGEAASCILANPQMHSKVTYKLTAKPYCNNDLAAAFSKCLGIDVNYEEVSYQAVRSAYTSDMGFPDWVADGFLEMFHMIDDGEDVVNDACDDFKNITGHEPTTIQEWVEENKGGFQPQDEAKEMPKLLVMGATGFVGTATLRHLAANSGDAFDIVAGTRDPSSTKAKGIMKLGGVRLDSVDMSKPLMLAAALQDADRVFIVVPGTEDRTKLAINAIDACKKAGVKFVVVVSVLTVDTDTVFGKHFQPIEQAVKDSGINYCILRLPLFMDNHLASCDTIKTERTFYGPQSPMAKFTPICVKDIGEAAATVLANMGDHLNKTYNLTTTAYSNDEFAHVLSKVAPPRVRYEQVPYEQAEASLAENGSPEWQVKGILELFKLIDSGSPATNMASDDFKTITGHDPSTIEEWAERNAGRFKEFRRALSLLTGELMPGFGSMKSKSDLPRIVVVGASGNVGIATVKALAANSARTHRIVAALRDPFSAKAKPLRDLGHKVELVKADMNDFESMDSAMDGADAVFVVTPGADNRVELTENACDAARKNHVSFLLVVSVCTAGTDTIYGKQFQEIEQNVECLEVPFCFLRLPLFLENTFASVDSIRKEGKIFAPQDVGAKFCCISCDDVGAAAAAILTDHKKHNGKTYNLKNCAFNNAQLADSLSKAVNKSIEYVQVPYDTAREGFLAAGIPEWQVNGTFELFKMIDEGNDLLCKESKDYTTITGRLPLTHGEWCIKYSDNFKPKPKEVKRPKVVVVGASGFVGTSTVKELAKHAYTHEVVVGVRDPSSPKCASMANYGGVKLQLVDMSKAMTLAAAFKGAERAFIVTPGHQDRAKLVANAVKWACKAKVKLVVVISQITCGTDTIFGRQLADVEKAVTDSGVQFCFLRLPLFIDNTWAYANSIKHDKKFYGPQSADGKFCPISVQDIGAAAAKILTCDNIDEHAGKTYTLTSTPYSNKELAELFSEAIAAQVTYEQCKYEETSERLKKIGAPSWQVDGTLEIFKMIDNADPLLTTPSDDFEKVVGRKPITIEQWVKAHRNGFIKSKK